MKSIVSTPHAPAAIGPYSQAIVLDGWVFTSGAIPLDAAGQLVPGGIEEQTEQVHPSVGPTRGEAGLTPSDRHGTEHRAEQGGTAPECDTRDHEDRRGGPNLLRSDDPDQGDEHRAPDAGHDRGDDEGGELDVGRVITQEPHALLGVAGRQQQLAETAAVELPHHDHADDEKTRGDEVDHHLVGGILQVVPEERREAAEACVTSGLADR